MAQERYPVTSSDESNTQTENLEIGRLNFPDLTSSELDSVTDAETGDTYFDTDRNQLVRFTGPSSYVPITSYTEIVEDTNSPIPVTFGDLTTWENDGVLQDQDYFSYKTKYGDTSGSSTSITFFTGFGWYDGVNNFDTNNVETSDNGYYEFRSTDPSLTDISISYKYGITNSNASSLLPLNILSKNLKKDTKYFVETNDYLVVNSNPNGLDYLKFEFDTINNDIKYFESKFNSLNHSHTNNIVSDGPINEIVPNSIYDDQLTVNPKAQTTPQTNSWIYRKKISFYITPVSDTTMNLKFYANNISTLLVSDIMLKITTLV